MATKPAELEQQSTRTGKIELADEVLGSSAQRTAEIRYEARDECDDIEQVAVLVDLSLSQEMAEKRKGFSPNLSW